MAKLYPYLNFENSKEALKYYEDVFSANILEHIPADKEMLDEMGLDVAVEDTTMHAIFEIQGNVLMASDKFGKSLSFGDGIALMLNYNSTDDEDMEKMNTLYKMVVEKGEATITEPLSEQFWGGMMGEFVDKYGVLWMLHAYPEEA